MMYVNVGELGDWQGMTNGRMVKELWLVKQADVLSVNGFVVKLNAEVTKMVFAQNTCFYTENEELTDNGHAYSCAIDCEMPILRADVNAWLKANRNAKVVCFFRDGNENAWLIGDDVTGLDVIHRKQVGDKTGYVMNVAGVCREGAVALRSSDVAVVFESTDFGFDFSEDFNS
ncbi:hypothetical protein [Lacihabitans soyangensis]|uniref:Uncharacterized protein n=1 Tax=Lacihabitans soyangensis TaxID=869394 RepID=A0AAE3H6Z8_9BACT|nr:hypothetical protein [Lacihabitans soyangensis]MCP9765151.1 hypothetical protein [Lacihabitans soyangensis]